MEKLDELELKVTEIENVLNNATKKADKAGAVIGYTETVFELAEGLVPIFGKAFTALNKVLRAVQHAKDFADDVIEAGRSAVDYSKTLIALGRKALDMEDEVRMQIESNVDEVVALLKDLSHAIGQFGKKGFIKKMWLVSKKTAKTLTQLDKKIRETIKKTMALYDRAKLEGIESMLKELLAGKRTFRMESKVEELVQRRMEDTGEDESVAREALSKDRDAAREAMEAGGVPRDLFEREMSQLNEKLDDMHKENVSLHKQTQQKVDSIGPDAGYWLELAIEVPPAVVADVSQRDRAAFAWLVKRLHDDLKESELRQCRQFPVCITDACNPRFYDDLHSGRINILIWCGLGWDVANRSGFGVDVERMEAHLTLLQEAQPRRPQLIVICMKYGAKKVAERLACHAIPVAWIEVDVASGSDVTSAFVTSAFDLLSKKVLPAVRSLPAKGVLDYDRSGWFNTKGAETVHLERWNAPQDAAIPTIDTRKGEMSPTSNLQAVPRQMSCNCLRAT